ncbi:MAG: phage terminase large subunit, partial [Hyphomicrobiales bacterium]
PQAILDEIKAEMGSRAFAAQYQQNPVPAFGNILKRDWLIYFGPLDAAPKGGMIVQSWDTASKPGLQNDWSVCVTAAVVGKFVYVIDVFRKRVAFPDLKAEAIRLALLYRATVLLVEDQSSGISLVQELEKYPRQGVPVPIARKTEGDKVSRVEGISAMVEAGQLLLPDEAPWLAELTSELLGFPSARFDDQTDAVAHLLHWVRSRQSTSEQLVGPIVFLTHSDGSKEILGDEHGMFTRPPTGHPVRDPWGP